MAADLLDQLQTTKLKAHEELVASYEEAVNAGATSDQEAAVADFFVDECVGLRQSALRLWDHYWDLALSGKVSDLEAQGRTVRALLERSGRILAREVSAARHYAERSGHEEARLAELEQHAEHYPVWVEECMGLWEVLSRPRKPLDRALIARCHEAFLRGEGETPADIIARIQAGKPLVRE